MKLLFNARVFAPEDLGICHVLIGGGRILRVIDNSKELPVAGVTEIDLVVILDLGRNSNVQEKLKKRGGAESHNPQQIHAAPP